MSVKSTCRIFKITLFMLLVFIWTLFNSPHLHVLFFVGTSNDFQYCSTPTLSHVGSPLAHGRTRLLSLWSLYSSLLFFIDVFSYNVIFTAQAHVPDPVSLTSGVISPPPILTHNLAAPSNGGSAASADPSSSTATPQRDGRFFYYLCFFLC